MAMPARLTPAAVAALRAHFTQFPDTPYNKIAATYEITEPTLKDALFGFGTYASITDPPPLEYRPRISTPTRSGQLPEGSFGQMVATRRAEMGVSQERLAKMLRAYGLRTGIPLGCTQRVVQRWESGKHLRPGAKYIPAIKEVLGITLPTAFEVSVEITRRQLLEYAEEQLTASIVELQAQRERVRAEIAALEEHADTEGSAR